MMRPFASRGDSRSAHKPCPGSTRARRLDRRLRPSAEAMESRQLMAGDVSAAVSQALQPYFDSGKFPGITVAVVTDGQVTLAQGYGVSDASRGTPVSPGTRFDIGSVTKTFTAVGVLMLYQDSQGTSDPLNLNAPIKDYLHNTGSFKLPPKWSDFTVMQLLDMTTGIIDSGGSIPWQKQVAAEARDRLLYPAGTESSYSDTDYNLLGELIEQRTGESYSTFLQNQIFGPLGMSSTEELGHSAHVAGQAVGYGVPEHGHWTRVALQNGPELYASAGVVSTAPDMATYMTALLSGSLLDSATTAMMWTATPTPQFGANPAADAIRGLGWDTAVDTDDGPVEVAKNGSIPGFTSQIILDPATDSGVFISFNANYQGRGQSSAATALQVATSVYQATQGGSLPGS